MREAYRQLAREPGGWVTMTDLRRALPDMPRAALDTTIVALQRTRATSIIPEANQKMLTQADWDAAVRIGGQPKHLISIDLADGNHRQEYVAARVADAHAQLTDQFYQPVSIAELRRHLGDINPAEVDTALRHLTGTNNPSPEPLPATDQLRMTDNYGYELGPD